MFSKTEVFYLEDAKAALTKLNLWSWFWSYTGSYMFPEAMEAVNAVDALGKVMHQGHSGASFAWTLHTLKHTLGGATNGAAL